MSKKSKRHQTAGQVSPTAVKAATGKSSSTIPMTKWMILLLLLLPVIYHREAMDPVLMPRYILLSVFIFLFVLFFYVLRKTALSYPLPLGVKMVFVTGLAFCTWSAAGLFTAVNPVAGYYELLRQLLNLLLLWLIMVMVSREERGVLVLSKMLLLVAVFQGLVGILQYYEVAFTELPSGAPELPYGLMSNRNLFGSAQSLLLPFLLFVMYKGSRTWKIIAALALPVVSTSILLSQTRSAWLAALAVVTVSFILVMIFSPADRKKWLLATLAGLVSVAAFGWLVLKTDKEGALASSISERAASLTGNKADTSYVVKVNVNERVMAWRKTRTIIKDHPVTGVGFGNWKIIVPAYGTAGMVWAKGLIVPDRPHNIYLQTAAETGIPGAILYFGMWAIIACLACMHLYKKGTDEQRVLVIVMLSGLAAFAVDGMFSFPAERIEHSLYLVLMGGIILGTCARAAAPAEKSGPEKVSGSMFRLPVAVMLVLSAANIFMGYKRLMYEIHMNYAKAYEDKKRYNEELAEVEAGRSSWVNLDPNGTPLEARAGIAYRGLKDYGNAVASFNSAAKYNPNSTMIYNNLGTVYTESGDFNKAITNYNKALKLAPEFDIVMKNLALNYFNVGKYDSCIAMINRMGPQGDEYFANLLREATRRKEAAKP